LASTAKLALSLWPTSFFSAARLPPLTSTEMVEPLPASASIRPLKM
jgi:hypothetical protein